jgi:hypothetical protein
LGYKTQKIKKQSFVSQIGGVLCCVTDSKETRELPAAPKEQ